MKTTLELPDDLYRKAKASAALRGETLTSLIRRALELVVAGAPAGAKSVFKAVGKRAALENDAPIQKWREDEAAFLKKMRGADLDRRSAAEIVREGRRG